MFLKIYRTSEEAFSSNFYFFGFVFQKPIEKLEVNGMLHPEDSNSAISKIKTKSLKQYKAFTDFLIKDDYSTKSQCQPEQNIFFLKVSLNFRPFSHLHVNKM